MGCGGGAGERTAVAQDDLGHTLQRLAPRWFVMRDAHRARGSVLLQPRWTMSFMRGPMTRSEIRGALRCS